MVVDRDGKDLLGVLLPDHVFVENGLDLFGDRQFRPAAVGAFVQFLANDVVAELDAFVADEHGRTRNKLAYLMLALAAERTIQQFAAVALAAGTFTHSVYPFRSKQIALAL